MKKLSLVFLFLVGLIEACSNNAIYFDIQQQKIKSCNSNGIICLYIEDESGKEFYWIEWINNGKPIPTEVSLDSIRNDYTISRGWQKIKINQSEFKLAPNKKYQIERAQGDASPAKIEVYTDERGKIYKTSKGMRCTHP